MACLSLASMAYRTVGRLNPQVGVMFSSWLATPLLAGFLIPILWQSAYTCRHERERKSPRICMSSVRRTAPRRMPPLRRPHDVRAAQWPQEPCLRS